MRKFLELAPGQRALLLRSVLRLVFAVLLVRLVPFRFLRNHLLAERGFLPSGHPRYSVEEIAWAVRTAGRSVPGATCIPQALAARGLLRAEGYEGTLRIGINKKEPNAVAAHAWVEHRGRIILGASPATPFTPLS